MDLIGRDHYRSGVSNTRKGMRTIYVRRHGKDTHDGVSMNSAVRTFKRAFELAPVKSSVGIIIDVGEGIWSEDITVPAIQFYGDTRYSRTIGTRIGLGGSDSNHLGLIIRGSLGPVKNGVGFEQPHGSKRYVPHPFVKDEFDANSNKVFYPSTHLRGTVFCTPGSSVEILNIDFSGKSSGVVAVNSVLTFKGCVFSSSLHVGINCEAHSDVWVNSCIFFSSAAVKLKTFSSARIIESIGSNYQSDNTSYIDNRLLQER